MSVLSQTTIHDRYLALALARFAPVLEQSAEDEFNVLGAWVSWGGLAAEFHELQAGLLLVLVEMDDPGLFELNHDLEVWSDDPETALLMPGQEITVEGVIREYEAGPAMDLHIVIDACI